MIKLLVSVRDVPEALLAARHGADFIDLKEPRAGALGGLPVETIAAIVTALRDQRIPLPTRLPISATIGDLGMDRLDDIVTQVHAVAACGVDYVKVGIERKPEAEDVLMALADSGRAVVPVFIADRGLDFSHVELACELGFPGIMVDTADKRAGSLFDLIDEADLRRFVDVVRNGGGAVIDGHRLVGMAGALRLQHLPALSRLQPGFAGFRSAVCLGDRGGALDARCLEDLLHRLRQVDKPRLLLAC